MSDKSRLHNFSKKHNIENLCRLHEYNIHPYFITRNVLLILRNKGNV